MQISSIEPNDLGKDGQEIADWVANAVDGVNYATQEEFYDMESRLITKACTALGWAFVPQNGGLTVYWGQ